LSGAAPAGNFTITPANQQCYTVPSTAARTITLGDGPSGRMITAVLVLTGTVIPTFSGNFKWNDNTAPEAAATKTVITLLWDGSEWLGAKGAGY
ncbi:hypothetical protein, partial [Pseudomonas aeruginosa]